MKSLNFLRLFFLQVNLTYKYGRDGNALLINLTERYYNEILIEGNEAIKTDNLLDGLQNAKKERSL